jgi:acetyltransferase-like isoleucine patch superfamily enzyme
VSSQDQLYQRIAPDVKLGQRVRVFAFTNLYGCEVSSHTFICEGVTIEDEVFIGHGVTFINDRFPRSTTSGGQLQTEADWKCESTLVKKGASVGSGATILCGITIGERAIIGAGSVVTKDVPAGGIVAGNPAKLLRIAKPE